MKLSRNTEAQLAEMARFQELYKGPREEIRRELGNRSLVMVVGPAATGKTFLMQHVAERDERFGLSSSITTRPRDQRDPEGLFRYYAKNEHDTLKLIDKFKQGDLVNYAVHPSELTFYGNELEDFPYTHNMLATLSGTIDRFKGRGFGDTHVIGLAPPPGDWRKWFNTRYKYADPARLSRLNEADKSYHDLIAREDVSWLINREGHVEEAADDLIHTVDGKLPDQDEALAYVHRILQLIETEKERAYTENHDPS